MDSRSCVTCSPPGRGCRRMRHSWGVCKIARSFSLFRTCQDLTSALCICCSPCRMCPSQSACLPPHHSWSESHVTSSMGPSRPPNLRHLPCHSRPLCPVTLNCPCHLSLPAVLPGCPQPKGGLGDSGDFAAFTLYSQGPKQDLEQSRHFIRC